MPLVSKEARVFSRGDVAASLYDDASGSHIAYIDGSTVFWTVDGRFLRSFRYDDPMHPHSAKVKHVLLTRFADSGSPGRTVALCIFLADALRISYYSTGEKFMLALPFDVHSVFPLHTGLLVQRKLADQPERSLFAASLPATFSLLNPRSEFKMLGISRATDLDWVCRQKGRQFVLSPAPSKNEGKDACIPIFNDPSSIAVGAASSRLDRSSQFVLCWESNTQTYAVYRCIVADQSSETEASGAIPDLGDNVDSSTADMLGADKDLLPSSRKGADLHTSLSMRRRSSAATAAAAVAASRRKASFGSAVKSDRRSSLLGRISFNDSPGPSYAVDVFCEQRQMKAEVVLHPCWKEKRQKGDKQADASWRQAQICVIQTAFGKGIVCVLQTRRQEVIGLDADTLKECFRYPAVSMAPVGSIRQKLDDLVLVTPSGCLSLVCGGGDPIACDSEHNGNIVDIALVEGTVATILVNSTSQSQTPAKVRASIKVRISGLALAILDALSFVLSRPAYVAFNRHAIATLQGVSSADEEMRELASLILDPSSEDTRELQARAPAALYALHLVYEDAAMWRAEPRSRIVAMGHLLLKFARQNGLSSAYQFYLREGFRDIGGDNRATTQERASTVHQGGEIGIPDFTRWALSVFNSSDSSSLSPFPALASIPPRFRMNDTGPAYGARDCLKLLPLVADVVWRLASKGDLTDILQKIASGGSGGYSGRVNQLGFGTQWLVRTVIMQMRVACSPTWPASVLVLLDRLDVAISSGAATCSGILPPPARHQLESSAGRENSELVRRSIAELCDEIIDQSAASSNANDATEQAVKTQEISKMTFRHDLRVAEAYKLLQSASTVPVPASLAGVDSAEGTENAKSRHMRQIACRTLALPPGRAFITYSTCSISPQDALAIPPLDVSAKFRGHKLPTAWDQNGVDMSWPLFHNGLAAALSVDRDQVKEAHPSWVLLNWPSEKPPNAGVAGEEELQKKYTQALASHAGFLLGMGLVSEGSGIHHNVSSKDDQQQPKSHNGPLCRIHPWQSFKYLSTRHSLTSIALLLGCACAHEGSMSASVYKLLALHIPSLLPAGSSELMLLSYGTQAAAMLGLGILYLGSQNRRIAEVVLRELTAVRNGAQASAASRLGSADAAESSAECYSLASGFALGLVVLGQGLSTRTLADLDLLNVLSESISSSSSTRGGGIDVGGGEGVHAQQADTLGSPPFPGDERVGRPGQPASYAGGPPLGAIAAIGLIFLGTNYKPAAHRLQLPQTAHLLRSADPFILFWMTLMRSLIMLESVAPSQSWVESNIPRAMCPPSQTSARLSPDLCRARLYIVSAACFAAALKHAGTEDPQAHETILKYFDEVEAILGLPALDYEASLTRASARACLDTLCISAALVMAGSGDVATMRRLRPLHVLNAERSYGSYLASHMALGVLFVGGGGRFTISNSRKSIALLLISFFPRFPRHFSDNREHLQAWRHLWALCVKPRCLVVRDAVSGSMCKDVRITLASHKPSGSHTARQLVPPVRFPSLANTTSIRLKAPGYMTLDLDLQAFPSIGRLVSERRVIYMQPLEDVASTSRDALPNSTSSRKALVHGLMTTQQYKNWLSCLTIQTAEVCSKLSAQNTGNGGLDTEVLFGVIRAIKQLRVCLAFVRSGFSVNSKTEPSPELAGQTQRFHWAEETALAWLGVHETVLSLGRSDASRRMLTVYWTRNQLQGGDFNKQVFGSVIALLNVVLDLPTPAAAMEIAKKVPIARLVDYVLN